MMQNLAGKSLGPELPSLSYFGEIAMLCLILSGKDRVAAPFMVIYRRNIGTDYYIGFIEIQNIRIPVSCGKRSGF